jgi:hypothetical protein
VASSVVSSLITAYVLFTVASTVAVAAGGEAGTDARWAEAAGLLIINGVLGVCAGVAGWLGCHLLDGTRPVHGKAAVMGLSVSPLLALGLLGVSAEFFPQPVGLALVIGSCAALFFFLLRILGLVRSGHAEDPIRWPRPAWLGIAGSVVALNVAAFCLLALVAGVILHRALAA